MKTIINHKAKVIAFFPFYLLTLLPLLVSCSDDDVSPGTNFPTDIQPENDFEAWLQENYTYPYNIDFKYRMEDIESDMSYNLVPADSAKSARLAIIIKYLWLDAYCEAAGQDFVKDNVPRVIHLVGSPAYNSNNTMVLGTAEGGQKVTLYNVNSLTEAMLHDYATLNSFYFHTIHHEFTHILNQKIPYDKAFDQITESSYISGDWYLYSDTYAHQHGFVSPYSMAEPKEDFAELLSYYVTISPEEWDAIVADGGAEGGALLTEKIKFVRTYMQESWNVSIDQLRQAVQHRAKELSSLDLSKLQ